jgi:hypothetical protein
VTKQLMKKNRVTATEQQMVAEIEHFARMLTAPEARKPSRPLREAQAGFQPVFLSQLAAGCPRMVRRSLPAALPRSNHLHRLHPLLIRMPQHDAAGEFLMPISSSSRRSISSWNSPDRARRS